MSILTANFKFLTTRPAIDEVGGTLTIKTGLITRLATLFLNFRRIEIDPERCDILIEKRVAYFFVSRELIDFDSVWYVDYSFDSLGTEWGMTSGSLLGRQDQVESFPIAVVTRDDRKHFVCAFRGEGAKCTGWTGVLLGGDDLLDFSGTQESESRQLATYLAKLIGTQIGKPLDSSIDMATCPECGRPTSPYKAKCLYCGAVLAVQEGEIEE